MNRFWNTAILAFLLAQTLVSQDIDMDLFHGMQPRNIGPAGMSGRVTSIDVVLADTDIIYIGAAAGGVWKSENAGHTWDPIFDDQKAASIGAIAIYQKNPSIIYVGTGEGNPRNSQNSGRGIFKSIDAGKTWQHLGLTETRQIHRVIVHPDNPDIVWAGVSGATWGESEERGVYKTTDGGSSWTKVLYINETTGVSDLVMDPDNPNKLIVGMWQHRRWPWTFKSGGPGSGMYITYDGGEQWKKITPENGIPKGELGRMGISFAPSNPRIVYAYIESKNNAIYRSNDGGNNWKMVSKKGDSGIGDRPFYYADIYVDTKNENRVYSIASTVTMSEDGGKTWSVFAPGNKIHTDHHAWWSHPDDPEFIILGHDGGLNTTHDRGENWAFADNLPLAQFYHIRTDNVFPYHVMGGLQDNGSWRGPNRTWFKGGIRNMYWQRLSVGDGFDVVPDPVQTEYGYAMGQAGNLVRYHTTSGQLKKIKPAHPNGDHLRFNWNAGIAIDPIDNRTIYYGSQFVHKSTDHGASWTIISPDLTTNDPVKTNFLETGGLTYDVTGAENHCTIISIDPSPINNQVIWAGTDDGNVQVTKNGGQSWTNVINRIPGVPANTWVTQITASTYNDGTAFVVFDDHRRNNWEPYVYRTNDFGVSWIRLADASDIDGYTYCFVQDPVVPELMFIGSEFGLYVSFNEGKQWHKWTNGLPTMPVSDLVIHPQEHDLVIGTFGRAIWILDDIRPLREMILMGVNRFAGTDTAADDVVLFDPPDEKVMIIGESIGYREGKIGDALYNGENRKYGALLSYWVASDTLGEAKFEITDEHGRTVRTLYHTPKKGLNRLNWETDMDAPRPPGQKKPDKDFRPRGGFEVGPGNYNILLKLGEQEAGQSIHLSIDPRITTSDSEANEKMALIYSYNTELSSVTELMDDVRNFETRTGILKEWIDLNEQSESDSLLATLKKVGDYLTAFKESILGKDVQGIYRDPSLLSSKLQLVRYAIDHPLSPKTPNQEVQLVQLKELIDTKNMEWEQLENQSSTKIRMQLDVAQLKLWSDE